MRALATVRTIDNLKPIEGADLIELAVVDGWECVVKKGDFTRGQTCVYFEIDSFLPERPEFEFLRKSCFRTVPGLGDGFRIKTIRLRGQISQGLAIPLNVFPEIMQEFHKTRIYDPENPNFDVTEMLGVQLYEKPIATNLAGQVKGNFPWFIPKSNQNRIQNIWKRERDILVTKEYEVTTKLDGSSCTMYMKDGQIGVCSRNMDLKVNDENKDNSFIRTAYDCGYIGALTTLNKNIAIQGELMGPKVEENKENLPKHSIFMYDVYDIDAQRYYTPDERHDLLSFLINNGVHANGLWPHVPVLHKTKNIIDEWSIDELLSLADGPSLCKPTREGVVFKAIDGSRSFKILSNKYLLKNDD